MVRFAVVGAGVMGTNHARVLGMTRDAELALIVDQDPVRGEALAKASNAEYSPDIASVAGRVDAAVLACPTPLHHALGLQLLESGLDVLIEKPMATTVEACRELVATAEREHRLLMVGHVERFNPAVMELRHLLTDVVHLDIARIGPRAPRITDDVVLDLMIHDLDLALALTQSPLQHLHAVGRSLDQPRCQLASALLQFENGATANLTASQIGQNKIRRLDITLADSFITVDLIKQDISVHRVSHSEFVSQEGARYRQTGVTEVPFLENRGEPLMLELRHFVDCIGSRARPEPSGEDGLAAVELALRVQALIGEG